MCNLVINEPEQVETLESMEIKFTPSPSSTDDGISLSSRISRASLAPNSRDSVSSVNSSGSGGGRKSLLGLPFLKSPLASKSPSSSAAPKKSLLCPETFRQRQSNPDYPAWAEGNVKFYASYSEKEGRTTSAPRSVIYEFTFVNGRFSGCRDGFLVSEGLVEGNRMMWREVKDSIVIEYSCEIAECGTILLGSFITNTGVESTRLTMLRMP